jgi:biofilm protein TabA
MIYDQLSKIHTYKGISGNLDTAIDYIASQEIGELAEGAHHIDGDNVVVHIKSYETGDPKTIKYEAHRKYIDIHFVVDGKEGCFYTPLEDLQSSEPFDENGDTGLYSDPAGTEVAVPLTPGVFALFFPHDGHKPSCELEGKLSLRKVIVKVAV